MRGKTAFIRGVDKPRIVLKDNQWYVSFLDAHIMSGTPTGMLKNNQDWDIQEYFYWTPDMPEIVAKQAHIMINYLESRLPYDELAKLTTKESSFDRGRYNDYADPLVYRRYVEQEPGQQKTYFSLGKPLSSNVWHKDIWFFQNRDVLQDDYNKWVAGLDMLRKKIPQHRFNKFKQDKLGELKDLYRLDQQAIDLGPILFGTVGIWSKFHPVKPYQNKIGS
jgi:hypothetical protein